MIEAPFTQECIYGMTSQSIVTLWSATTGSNIWADITLDLKTQRKQAYDTFFTTLDKLRVASEPLSEDAVAELVEREIEAYRAEKRQNRDTIN